jgi:hypothetical protein
MINQRFGKLVVIEYVGSNHYGKIWKCQCDCGNKHNVVAARLRDESVSSCGCSKKYENLQGKKFGRLIVKNLHTKNRKNIKWMCECDCGNTTTVKHDHLKSGHTQSCGCYNKDRIRETKIENLVGKKYNLLTPIKIDEQKSKIKKKIYWWCKCNCGKECNILSSSIVSGNTKSCGCLRKNQKKEKHPRWNPNISQEERGTGKRKYNTDEHKKWRKLIFEKNWYMCQISGQKGGRLVAHHIKSWNNNKNLRFDISNGITMARKLHIRFHKKYGYGNNDESQLKEFINEYNKNKKNQRFSNSPD